MDADDDNDTATDTDGRNKTLSPIKEKINVEATTNKITKKIK